MQDQMAELISFATSTNKDTMYWHQAMKPPDANEFKKTAIKVFDDHYQNKYWELIERSKVPSDKNVSPLVWAMRGKQDLRKGKITKYKASINIHGVK